MSTNRFARKGYFPLAAVLGAAVAMLPAVASSETTPIDAVNEGFYEHHWSPSAETVVAGEAVTFRNLTAVPHGVNWISPPAQPECDSKVPVGTTEAASGTNWSGACKFTQPGTYLFYCTVHGSAMSGTVRVSAGGSTTTSTTTGTVTTPVIPPATTPGPAPESPPAAVKVAKSQRGGMVKGLLNISQSGVGRRLEIDVFVRSASLAKAKPSGRVRVGQLLRNSVSAGRMSFSIKLSAKARSALRRHRRLALTVKIMLAPSSGEPFSASRSVIEHA